MIYRTFKKKVTNRITTYNIKNAQEKQKNDFDRRHLSSVGIKIGDKVLVRNNKTFDRKGGKFTNSWKGPYVVSHLTPKRLATLDNLKTKCNRSHLKLYVEGDERKAQNMQVEEGEEVARICEPVIVEEKEEAENPVQQSPDEKRFESSSSFACLPVELVENIINSAVKMPGYSFPGHKC